MGDTAIRLLVDYGTDITALEPTIFAYADSIASNRKAKLYQSGSIYCWANGKTAKYTVRIFVSTIQFPVIKTIAAGYSHVIGFKK